MPADAAILIDCEIYFVTRGVFTDKGFILGKVFLDCNANGMQDAGERGVPGVRVLIEDGTYVITDGGGKFSFYGISSHTHVVKVDRTAPLELLGPLGCGIQTGAGAVLNSLHPHAGSSIVVFGVGSVGLAAVMAAQVAGCTTIVAVDLKASRLEAAKRVGATHVIDPVSTDNVVGAIQDITGGGAHYSLETTASPKVFRQSSSPAKS